MKMWFFSHQQKSDTLNEKQIKYHLIQGIQEKVVQRDWWDF